jgi:predicted short-subunit dehydrogenase-like oxidoreductase (DUF2520 family)
MQPSRPSPPLDVALVGGGRVGTAVAQLLRGRGHRVAGVWSRTRASAERAAGALGARTIALEEVTGDLVLIAVTDAAIAPVATRLAPFLPRGCVVCHFAGGLGVAPLRSVQERGAWACALHPVQSCPDVEAAVRRLPGSAWGLTCTPGIEPWATALIARDLQGFVVEVSEGDRPLWHAAAVTAANGIVALMATSEAMLEAIGAPARAVLAPLAAGALENARERGAAASLTGPIVRGEVDALSRHLRVLAERDPRLVPGYVAASRVILAGARDAGWIPEATVAALDEVLGRAWN